MNFSFSKIYCKSDEDGLLKLIFFSSAGESLIFNGGGFCQVNEAIDPSLYSEWKLKSNLNHISGIRTNEDMDFLVRVNDEMIIVISFFPNDAFQNGVEQVFRVYDLGDIRYEEMEAEFRGGTNLRCQKAEGINR